MLGNAFLIVCVAISALSSPADILAFHSLIIQSFRLLASWRFLFQIKHTLSRREAQACASISFHTPRFLRYCGNERQVTVVVSDRERGERPQLANQDG